MEPRIQYAKTADGVSIAYNVVGEGKPYISMPPLPWSHIERMWQTQVFARRREEIARKRQLSGDQH